MRKVISTATLCLSLINLSAQNPVLDYRIGEGVDKGKVSKSLVILKASNNMLFYGKPCEDIAKIFDEDKDRILDKNEARNLFLMADLEAGIKRHYTRPKGWK